MELAFDDRKEQEENELNIQLTSSQEKALTAFSNWVNTLNPDNKCSTAYRLNGEAGTGKTFLVKEFIKVLKENKLSVATIAFTGKAASRLQELTGVPSCTIHRLIYDFSSMSEIKYFESTEDEQKAYEDHRQVNQVLSKDCIIIDEYSMLTREIIQDMIELNKILIFVGDLNQLPPIGEELITFEEMKKMFKEVITLELTDPVRQDIYNPILTLARKVKNGLTTLKEYDTDHELSFAKIKVSKDPKLDPSIFSRDENIIITYTNQLKNQLNRAVRKSLNFKNLIEIGEKIIIMQNDKENALFNGEMYRVLEVGEERHHLGFKYCSITIDTGTTDRVIRQRLNIWLNPLENGVYRYQTTQEQQNDKYEQYKMFKSLTQIAYGYAITCHKAQGSEWETVYIRYDDCKYDKKRWLYTALTRAKTKCIIKIL